ncbi:hypothetical protein BH09PAT4_BH09PAT4_05000 [soil metagenome]
MRRFLQIGSTTMKSAVFVSIVLAISAFILLSLARSNGLTTTNEGEDPYLNRYLQRSLVGVNSYTSPDLRAPTNKWFSSLAFKQPSDPVFAWPLALQTSQTGMTLSQPQISATADTVKAPFTADIAIKAGEQITQMVTGYDDLSVSIQLSDQKQPVIDSRLTRGSPYLFMTLHAGRSMTMTSSDFTLTNGKKKQQAVFTKSGIRYGVMASKAASFVVSGTTLQIKAGDSNTAIALFAIPKNADFELYANVATHPLTKTSVTHKISNNRLHTTYQLTTKDGEPTLFGLLPFASQSSKTNLGSFQTLEGTQTIQAGNEFSYNTASKPPQDSLAISALTAGQRSQLKKLIVKDAANLKFTNDTSYFGGKELYRAAQLLQLAKQLDMAEQADTVQSSLKTRLAEWLDPTGYEKRSSRYFYYDNNLGGLVAAKPDFGSDAFNDHHFHYGYYLEAASILAKYDTKFMNDNRASIDLLVKDIMNTDRSSQNFPYLRTFDQYVGHSWASGFGTFADGQNQESSSEAVNAWYGAYEWGKVSDNSQIQSTALALYTLEAHAARTYWLSSPKVAGYAHDIAPLVWSGKLDYATFFNNTPEAKLGIQLIPMSPGSTYLATDGKAKIQAHLKNLSTELAGKPTTVFKDYLAMYQALYDSDGAAGAIDNLKPSDIDDANSMSYLYAWVHSQQ